MLNLPVISGKRLVNILKSHGFEMVRQKGSHVRLKLTNDRVTTVPVHGNKDLPKGLLRKILFQDLKLSPKEASNWLKK